MKNAMIFHGISSNPKEFWFPWLKKEFEKKGYDVWVPQLPANDTADLKIVLPYVLKKGKFTENTLLVGHSSGASLILAILDSLKNPINQAILISGFLTTGGTRPAKAVKDENNYDWEKMKKNSQKFIFINSSNDPWGCDDKQGRKMFDHLGGMQIINNEGHMGSNAFNQPYKEFPLLLKLIEE